MKIWDSVYIFTKILPQSFGFFQFFPLFGMQHLKKQISTIVWAQHSQAGQNIQLPILLKCYDNVNEKSLKNAEKIYFGPPSNLQTLE